jgi:hypothetical protein
MTTEVVPQQRTSYETKQVMETLAVTKPTVSHAGYTAPRSAHMNAGAPGCRTLGSRDLEQAGLETPFEE